MTVKYLIEPPADMSTLPPPPVPEGLDLTHFDCMHLNTEKLLQADIWDECSDTEIAVALRLWAHAWRQIPCSSLPNNDAKVRKMAGCEGKNRRWNACKFGALRNFYLASDGRLYHGSVAKAANEAATKSRAGKRGAKAKWDAVKSLGNNNTGSATASGRTDGRCDGTLYSSGHGRPHGKRDAEKGRDILPPLPPSLPSDGSDRALGPTARPPQPAQDPYDHGFVDKHNRVVVHFPDGVKLKISDMGIVDLIDHDAEAIIPEFTSAQAIELRNRVLAGEGPQTIETAPEPTAEAPVRKPAEDYDPVRDMPPGCVRSPAIAQLKAGADA